MGPHEFERWILARTELIVTARLMKQKGLTIMPLELKRLQGKAMSFRANIDAIGREYDGANEVAAEHLADVKSLRAQVSDMKDDLTATVDITKNSVAASNAGEASEQPKQELPPTLAHEPPALPRMPADTPQSWQTALQQPEPQVTPQDPSRAIVR